MIISTFKGDIFGAYLSDGLHCNTSFYGNGECFLYKFIENNGKIEAY